nr:chloramphenicol acetyltransferase-like domain-containing protein [Tanacetum cinerariifolium]
MGKIASEKNRCITVNLHYDGVFTVSPFEYSLGDEKQTTDIHFEGTPLKLGINIIKTDSDVDEFVNFGYRNKWQVNLYVEHSGYDAFEIRDQEEIMADDGNESSDAYFSSDEEDLSYVDFHIKADDNCGRDVEASRCVGYDSIKKTELGENESLNVNKVTTRSSLKVDEGISKSPKTPVKAITSGEGYSESPNLANSNKKEDRKKPVCGFRNYNLGSLVTYRWIAHHYAKRSEMTENEIRKNLEHDYMEELLLQEEQKLQAYETEQDEFDQEALRLTLEEEAMYKRMDEERLKEQMAEEEWDRKIDYYHPSNMTQEEESFDHEPYNRNVNTLNANVQTQESVAGNMSNRGDYEAKELVKKLAEPIVAVTPSAEPIASATHSTDKGKQVAEPQGKKKGSKRKPPASSEEAAGNQRIVFNKNRERSERIFNQKIKKSDFGPNGKGSTPD